MRGSLWVRMFFVWVWSIILCDFIICFIWREGGWREHVDFDMSGVRMWNVSSCDCCKCLDVNLMVFIDLCFNYFSCFHQNLANNILVSSILYLVSKWVRQSCVMYSFLQQKVCVCVCVMVSLRVRACARSHARICIYICVSLCVCVAFILLRRNK